jgi:hypothetical protein
MKIIDLLNKIANGEKVPKKIRITDIDDRITKHYNFFYDEDEQEYKDDELFPLGARLILDRVLNEKVEIIEEPQEHKIPEKLRASDYKEVQSQFDLDVISRINEILDYLEVNND